MHRPPIKSQNASLYLSFAVLVDPQLFHPVGISEGVQSVLAGGHARTDHCDHARPRLRVLSDTLRWTLVVRMLVRIMVTEVIFVFQVSGVITYDECTVNFSDMMNKVPNVQIS